MSVLLSCSNPMELLNLEAVQVLLAEKRQMTQLDDLIAVAWAHIGDQVERYLANCEVTTESTSRAMHHRSSVLFSDYSDYFYHFVFGLCRSLRLRVRSVLLTSWASSCS